MTKTKHPMLLALDTVGGRVSTLAAALHVERATMYYYLDRARKGVPTPPKLVLRVAELTDLRPHDVRPDMYPRDYPSE